MAEVRVRNIGESVIGEFKDRAKRHGRSLEAELRELITNEAMRPRRELVHDLDQFTETMRAKYGLMPDTTPLIREERDRRG